MFIDLEDRLKYKYKVFQNIEQEFFLLYEIYRDAFIKDYFVLKYLDFVYDIAHKIYINISGVKNFGFSDLVEAGRDGLLDAIQKYDSDRNNKFSTYAYHRIRGSMLDSIRDSTRHYKRYIYYDSSSLIDYIECIESTNEDHSDNIVAEDIRKTLKHLSLDEELFMRMYYFADLSKTKISQLMDITSKQVSFIEKNAMSKLYRYLNKFKDVFKH